MVSSAQSWLKRHTHWPSTPGDLPRLKLFPGTVNALAKSECVLPFLWRAHFNFRIFYTGKHSHWSGQRLDHRRLLGKTWLGLSSRSMPNLLPLVLWQRRSNPSARDVHQWVPVHLNYILLHYILPWHYVQAWSWSPEDNPLTCPLAPWGWILSLSVKYLIIRWTAITFSAGWILKDFEFSFSSFHQIKFSVCTMLKVIDVYSWLRANLNPRFVEICSVVSV